MQPLAHLALWLLALAPGPAWSDCLDDAVQPVARVSIDCGNGTLVPVGLVQGDWDSSLVTTRVGKILIQEVLGYNTAISMTVVSSEHAAYALAGCKYPAKYAGCSNKNPFLSHITFELWGVYSAASVQARLAAWPDIIPDSVGSLGYAGEEGMYVWEDLVKQAYDLEGLPLDTYRGYDVQWHKAWKYFDNYTALDPNDMQFCNETLLTSTSDVEDYLRVTGDSAGVVSTPAGLQGRCWSDHYWFSPACRGAPETCIIWLTASSWSMFNIMQRVSYYNMPFVVASARSSALYVSLSQRLKLVPYWFQPDSSFIEFAPRMVVFPPANVEQQSRGIRVTSLVSSPIAKWVYANMKKNEVVLHDFMSRFTLSMEDVKAMMLDKKLNASDDYDAVACRWVRSHTATWKPWIPLTTSCMSGQGLVDKAGAFASERSLAKGCDWCHVGFHSTGYSDDLGPTRICQPCPPGTQQGLPGQASCTPCAAGTFALASASAECARCAVAWYQDAIGSSGCKRCPDATTTMYLAATVTSDCVCPAGMYQPLGQALSCVTCPLGLVCSEPNCTEAAIANAVGEVPDFPFPEAAPGYMTRPGAPLAPYLCTSSDMCPGGRVGSCGGNRDPSAIACGRCLPNMYETTDRGCSECEGEELAVLVSVAVVGGITSLAVLALIANGNALRKPKATTSILILVGLSFTCLQTIGVFRSMSVKWSEPLKAIFSAVSLLSFDFHFLRVECVVGSEGFQKYVFRLLVAPVGAVVMLATFALKRVYLRRQIRFVTEAVNTIGALYSVFFISIALSVLVPFVCYKHPGSQGWSLVQNPSIECFVGGHYVTMMAAGLAACAVVLLPFVALVAYGTLCYPRFVRDSTADGGVKLHMFHFLYFRCKPKAYYYSLVALMRNLSLCLVPVVIRDSGAEQVIAAAAILHGFAVLELRVGPWRSELANIVDGLIAVTLALMLMCSCMVSNFPNAEETAGTLGLVIFVFLVLCVGGVLLYALYTRLLSRTRFGFFVSHHKADAATQARFLQLLLQRKSGQAVFIDSDHLTDLDQLFDIVRSSVRWLVVLLTSDTLRRVWCAGEIAAAYQTHRRMKAVKTPSFESPTAEQLQDVGAYLYNSETNLNELGISHEAIAKSYEYLLRDVSLIELVASRPGRRRFDEVAASLSGGSVKKFTEEASSMQPAAMMLVVSCDPEDDEAVSAAGIIVIKLQEAVMHKVHAGISVLADSESPQHDLVDMTLQAYAVILVLTRGTLWSKSQLHVMLTAGAEDLDTVLVSTPSFRFPDQAYYADALELMVPEQAKQAAAALQRLFKRIAVFLATAASDRVLDAQVAEVLGRLPGQARAASMSADTSSLVRSLKVSSVFSGRTSVFRPSDLGRLPSDGRLVLAPADDDWAAWSLEEDWAGAGMLRSCC